MEKIKNIKPVYLYIIAGLLAGINTTVEKNTVLNYALAVLALSFFIWAVFKYFRKEKTSL